MDRRMKTYPPKIQAILDRIRNGYPSLTGVDELMETIHPLADYAMELKESLDACRGVLKFKPKHNLK